MKLTDLKYILALLALSMPIVACGGGSSSSGTTAAESPPAESITSSASAKPFKGPATFTKFGQPAGAGQVAEISTILAANLEAREAADFAGQCAALSAKVKKNIGAESGTSNPGQCSRDLRKIAEPLASTAIVRENTMSEPVADFRVKGNIGYALYHGNDGKDYAMEFEREGGRWLVASLTTNELE